MPRTRRRSTVTPFTRAWRPRSPVVDDMDAATRAAEMAALFPRLPPSLQRSFVALARVMVGGPIDRAHAWERAGDLAILEDEAGQLARRLQEGCGDRDE